MSFRKPSCYISYSHEDIDKTSLDAFVIFLNEISNNKIDVKYDSFLKPGDNVKDFMNYLENIDATIIIMTPSYKMKLMNRIECGVYKEFNIIHKRYLDLKAIDEKKNLKKNQSELLSKFDLIPILFSGKKETAVIDELKELIYSDFSKFKAIEGKNGRTQKPIIPQSIKSDFKNKMRDIVSVITQTNSFNSPIYKSEYNRLFGLLFEQTKADWSGIEKLKRNFCRN